MLRSGLIMLAAASLLAGAGWIFVTQHAEAEQAPKKPAVAASTAKKNAAKVSGKPAEKSEAKSDIETTNFGHWTLSCRKDAANGKECSAVNRVVEQKSGQVIFIWMLGKDREQNVVSYFQTPTGVIVSEGIRLVFGEGDAQKVDFRACDNRRCDGSVRMDDALIKKVLASKELPVQIVSSAGHNLLFKLDNSGIERILPVLTQ